jgi:hypothetical protein
MLREYLSNLANKFRSILGTTEKINAQHFPDKVVEVWEAGKQAEYDRFWDNIQADLNNKKIGYSYLFAGGYWNDTTFKPKYDIVGGATNLDGTFMRSYITDLKAILERENKVIDFSNNTYITDLFRSSTITHIPALKFTNSPNLQHIFNGCKNLHTIDELDIGEKVTYIYYLFNNCSALENVVFKGVLNCNGVSVNTSPKLTKNSLLSLLAILKDNSTTGAKLTITLGTTNLAKLTDAEKAIATQKGWTLA